ncbi:unnamed protein product, partial [Staurois parvus]
MPLVPFFIGFFEFGQGHRGHMIPYCPGGPMSCQSAPGWWCGFEPMTLVLPGGGANHLAAVLPLLGGSD